MKLQFLNRWSDTCFSVAVAIALTYAVIPVHAQGDSTPDGDKVGKLFSKLIETRGEEYRGVKRQILENPAAKEWLSKYTKLPDLGLCERVFSKSLLGQLVAQTAGPGPVQAMIEEAREAGSIRAPGVVSGLAVELGLREIGTSGITDALSILLSESDTDDVLTGLLRGLGIMHDSTDPGINTVLCRYANPQDLGTTQLRQLEALEALRIRCTVHASACTCSAAVQQAFSLLEGPSDELTRLKLLETLAWLGQSQQDAERLIKLADSETEESVRNAMLRTGEEIKRRIAVQSKPESPEKNK